MIEIKTNACGKPHKVVNGTWYHIETADDMIMRLEFLRLNRTRVRFHWGDTSTGLDWGDIYDVSGRIGRSTGSCKIPLLVNNARSSGGNALLDHCIVRITETTKPHSVLYSHPNYHVKTSEAM